MKYAYRIFNNIIADLEYDSLDENELYDSYEEAEEAAQYNIAEQIDMEMQVDAVDRWVSEEEEEDLEEIDYDSKYSYEVYEVEDK